LCTQRILDVSTPSSANANASQGFLDKHHFLLRRLHSLTGIVPIGVFLINHLLTNSSILWGKIGLRAEGRDKGWVEGGTTYFWKEVRWINEQIPHLLLIEVALWGAIFFHSVLGFMYARTGRSNTAQYGWGGSWRYKLQRITGYIAIFYIFYHVATLRWGWTFLVPGGAQWSHEYAASTMAMALRGHSSEFTIAGFLVSAFYFVGITSSVYHFANGLWTSAITWGITVSQKAQQRWGVACAGLGVAMMAMAWGSLVGFMMLNPAEVRKYEEELLLKESSAPRMLQAQEAPGASRGTGAGASGGGDETGSSVTPVRGQ
jgi:succinate dehydrogenase / fumarate reductase, cytochrome b subunit